MNEWAVRTLPALSAGEDDAVANTLPLLLATAALPHKNGSLLSHLCGTARILAAERTSTDIVGAGLFHSIYSTEFYSYSTLCAKRRPDVTDIIGKNAENLVHLFCTIQRSSLWEKLHTTDTEVIGCVDILGRQLALPKKTAHDLFQIECANIIEQSSADDGGPEAFMAWYFTNGSIMPTRFAQFSSSLDVFTEDNEIAAIGLYQSYLCGREPEKNEFLLSAIELNPFSFELQLFTALNDFKLGDLRSANLRLTKADFLLDAWGTPWDKRLTFANWKQLISDCKDLHSRNDAAELTRSITNSLNKKNTKKR